MKLLVDADIVCFRAAFSAENDPLYVACARADEMLDNMLEATNSDSAELWLSGPDNFRYKIYPEYKANRITAKRPKWEKELKEYFVTEWQANWSQGCEADDMLGVQQCAAHRFLKLMDPPIEVYDFQVGKLPEKFETCIATIDKDLDMIPGWHYNFVQGIKYFVDDDKALRNFYYQCLVGDSADGVKGVHGIGPKKAKAILDSCETIEELHEAVKEKFSCEEEFEMNASVLWIWRKPNDIWKDPYVRETENYQT